jgi:hypothetical protein
MRKIIVGLVLIASPALAAPPKQDCSRDGFGFLHCVDIQEQKAGVVIVTPGRRQQQVTKIKALISAGDCKGAKRYAAGTHDPEIEQATNEACTA